MYLGPQITSLRRCECGPDVCASCRRDIARTPACTVSVTRCCVRTTATARRGSGAPVAALQPAYAPGLRAGCVPRLLDLAPRRGRDDAVAWASSSPRVLCDGRLTYIRPCWYRYFLEKPLMSLPVRHAGRPAPRSCRGLRVRSSAFGCVSARGAHGVVEPVRSDAGLRRLRGRDGAPPACAASPIRRWRGSRRGSCG